MFISIYIVIKTITTSGAAKCRTGHTPDRKEILEKLDTNEKNGLTQAQYNERYTKYGPNRLASKKKETNLARFFRQFKDVMIIILLIAAVISFIVALNGHEDAEFLEPVVIIGIVIMNAVLGMTQESKAERALEALQGMTAPRARVLRDGKEQLIDTQQIVPGMSLWWRPAILYPPTPACWNRPTLRLRNPP
jgi:Ca2+-transporting ATPase